MPATCATYARLLSGQSSCDQINKQLTVVCACASLASDMCDIAVFSLSVIMPIFLTGGRCGSCPIEVLRNTRTARCRNLGCMCVYVCVCVLWKKEEKNAKIEKNEKKKEKERGGARECVCVCGCVCTRQREEGKVEWLKEKEAKRQGDKETKTEIEMETKEKITLTSLWSHGRRRLQLPRMCPHFRHCSRRAHLGTRV